jgi:hypothetical protein
MNGNGRRELPEMIAANARPPSNMSIVLSSEVPWLEG